MVISMISKLATLALASSVIMMHMPVAQAALDSPLHPPAFNVSFFHGEECIGPNIQYSSSLDTPDSCDTSCQDLGDYLSVSIMDSTLGTTCYLWQVPGCAGNYTGVARSSYPKSQCTTNTGFMIQSVWCYRGTCPA